MYKNKKSTAILNWRTLLQQYQWWVNFAKAGQAGPNSVSPKKEKTKDFWLREAREAPAIDDIHSTQDVTRAASGAHRPLNWGFPCYEMSPWYSKSLVSQKKKKN